MGVPQVYRIDRERVISTFDHIDIASGLGYITFYGIGSEDNSAQDHHLITNADAWSDPAGSARTGVGTTEYNFDTAPFNLPRNVKGTAYFSAGMGQGGSGETARIKVQLIHVDSGASETTISAEITTATNTASGSAGVMYFVPIPITTQTHFKKGEILRLQVKIEKVSGGSRLVIGHDPANQAEGGGNFDPANSAATTTMRLLMPFKVDL